MKKKWFKYLFLLFASQFLIIKISAQWTISVRLRTAGNSSFCKATDKRPVETWNYPTEQECLSAYRYYAGYKGSISGPGCETFYEIISPCFCTDPNKNKGGISNYGETKINGVNEGGSTFSSNPASEVEDWATDFQVKKEALGANSNESKINYIPISGNSYFDEVYKKDMSKIHISSGLWDLVYNSFIKNKSNFDMCDLVKKTFMDMMGYSPDHIGFILDEKKQQEAIDYYNWLGKEYANEANKIMNENIESWKSRLNVPEWTDIYESVDNPQRFATVLGEASSLNDNHIPLLIASDTENYHMHLENKNLMLSVAKDGTSITITDLGKTSLGFMLEQSKHSTTIGDQVKSFSSDQIKYNLKEDGSSTKSKLDDSPTGAFSYSSSSIGASASKNFDLTHINSPKLTFSNENSFYIRTNKIGFFITGEMSLGVSVNVPVDISADNDKPSVSGSLGMVKGSYSENKKEEKSSIGGGVTFGPSANIKGIAEFNTNISLEAGVHVFKQGNASYMANQLPPQLAKKMYNDFFDNSDMIQNSFIDTKKGASMAAGGYTSEIPRRTLSQEEIDEARKKFNEEIDKKILNNEKEEINESPKEYFKACEIK